MYKKIINKYFHNRPQLPLLTMASASILIGVLLRLFFLNFHPLSEDELTTIGRVTNHSFEKMLVINKVHDTQQPLYYVILKVQNFFKSIDSPLQARFISMLFGILTLLVNFKLISKVFKREIALISTGLLSLSFIALHHTNEARMYSLLLLLSVVSLYSVIKIVDQGDYSRKIVGTFIITQMLLVYTHHFGYLSCLTNFAYIFINQFIRKKIQWKYLFGFFILLLLATLPITVDFIKDFNEVHSYRPRPDLLMLIGQLSYLFSGKYFFLVSTLIITSKVLQKKIKPNLLFLILVPVCITYLKSVVFSPTFEARYLIFILPAFYLMLAKSIIEIKYKVLTFFILILLSMMNITYKESYFQYPYRLDTKKIAVIGMKFHEELKSKELIFCNTCPSFYVDKYLSRCAFHFEDVKAFLNRKQTTWVVLNTKKNVCSILLLEDIDIKEVYRDDEIDVTIYKSN